MASISLRNVVKRYGGAAAPVVIHGASAEVPDGEFVVIVGPSGCGKSTLLRMVAGLEAISAGEIAIGGRVVNDVDPAARDIAMVFQNYALYPHMSVYDNLAYGLRIRSLPRAEIEQRVQRAAQTLEIAHLLERKPRQLSGGQRQRVAMGRAIVRSPQVFLFDEPLSNLDAKLRAQTRLEIRRLHRELGVTSLFVTHDQVEAMTLAQRMMVMNSGRIEQIGTPEDVYLRPATTFVAGFIGSPPMNFFELTVSRENDQVTVKNDAFSLSLAASHPLAQPVLKNFVGAPTLTAGIRAEHLKISRANTAKPSIHAQVEVVEPAAPEVFLYLKSGAASFVMRDDTLLEPVVKPGETLGVYAEPEHIHFFDSNGQRLI